MDRQVARTAINLPANFVQRLGAGIAESRASTVINAGGKPLLRLLKDGEWVFGQGDEQVQEGSRWVINVASIGHGYCCWIDGSLRGEIMVSVFDPKPPHPAPIDGVPFKEQRSFDLKCFDGDDAGTEVLYKTSSLAGMSESDRLFASLQARIVEDQTYIFPVVVLKQTHYMHKKHGKIYTPVLEIVGWADQNGQLAGGKAIPPGMHEFTDANGPEQAQPQRARQRKAPIGQTEEPPLTTQQAHATGAVRRRPGR